MSKDITPTDYDGEPLAIGDYVEYDGKIWEIVDYEDSEQPAYDHTANTDLLLACRSHDHENIWLPDYEVAQTNNKQLYFNL